MPKCELAIVLDRPGVGVRPGEKLRGRVEVLVSDRARCQALSVWLRWSTERCGNVSESGARVTLFEGEWSAGERHAYPFELEVPRGPYSYDGEHLNIVWRVFATADLPWAIDPKTSIELVVLPATEERAVARDPADRKQLDETRGAVADVTQQMQQGCAIAVGGCGGLLTLAGVIWTVAVIPRARDVLGGTLHGQGAVDAVIEGALAPALFVLGVVILWKTFLATWLAERRLGKVRVSVEPMTVGRGGTLRCAIRFKAVASFELIFASATLRASESCTHGDEDGSKTYLEVLHEEDVTLAGNRAISAGEEVELVGELVVPARAAPTFSAQQIGVSWEVLFRLAQAGRPEWQQKVFVRVVAHGPELRSVPRVQV
jgi:hypothetical protein